MKSSFFPQAKVAVSKVHAAQARNQRLKARADRRLEVAIGLHAQQVETAEQVEAAAWGALLAVPGVTVSTAAVMLQVSETTVSRWAGRVGKPGGAR
jgi:hypothetical protein